MTNNLLKTDSFIDGCWVKAENKVPVTNPATNKLILAVSNGGQAHVKLAIDAAERALPHWRAFTAQERSTLLRRWFDLINADQAALASIITKEQGKPLAEASNEVSYGAQYIQWFSEEAKRIYGDVLPSTSNDKQLFVLKQAVGIVGAITPWNFPNAMITRKAAAALAAGCTFIVRPDITTPFSALALAELALQAGIPPGVFNVVLGDDSQGMGEILTQDPRIAKFSFTGSTNVGKLLLKQCATTIKKVSMELGGNAPFIVFDDADVDAAVSGFMKAKFRNAGQTCIAANRLFLHEDIQSKFIEKLTIAISQLNIGNGEQSNTDIGPLISEKAVERADALVEEAISSGATLLYKYDLSSQAIHTNENYFPPTILTDVTHDMGIVQKELFSPIVAVISFTDEQQVVAQANNTDAGLAAYFYTENIKRIWRVAKALQFGMVGINDGAISTETAPFGGIKQSGNGREGSKYGLDDYLEIKYLSLAGLS